jgi:hypothetical protein
VRRNTAISLPSVGIGLLLQWLRGSHTRRAERF